MNCKSAQNRLSAYIDRELNGGEMLALRDHVSQCRVCREELESLRSLKCLMSGFIPVEPPTGMEARLLIAVRTRAESSAPSVTLRKIQISWPTAVGLVFGSMAVTLFLAAIVPQATRVQPVAKSTPIPFEVQRDQSYAASSDPYGGAPIISATYGIR